MRILLNTQRGSEESAPIFPTAADLTDEVIIEKGAPLYAGPYSLIYRGTCRGVMVAVKVIQPIGDSARRMRRKVDRERSVWAALSHPNMIPLFGYTEPSDLFGPFGAFISPWHSKGDAAKFIRNQGSNLPSEYRINLWRGVIAGVAYLHGYTPVIVHGDLKSSNVLVDEYCNAQICDFGLSAILAEEGPSGFTTTSPYTGTERYIAPELLSNGVTTLPTTASDVWALGCIGLEFVFLQAPYQSRPNGRFIFQDIQAGILPGQKPSLDEQPDYDGIWQLVESCWTQEPEHRPTASSLLEYLETVEMEDLHGGNIGTSNWDHIIEKFRDFIDDLYLLASSITSRILSVLDEPTFSNIDAQRFGSFPTIHKFIQFLQNYHSAITADLTLKLVLRNYLSQRLLDEVFSPFSPGTPLHEDKEWMADWKYLQKTKLQVQVGNWKARSYLVLQNAYPFLRSDLVESLLVGINTIAFHFTSHILNHKMLDDLIPRIWHLVDTAVDFKYATQVKCTEFSFEVYSGEEERSDPSYVEPFGNRRATEEVILPIGLGLRGLKTGLADEGLDIIFYPVQKALVMFDNWELAL